MGMYTEINCAFEMKKDTPVEVLNLLKYMVGDVLDEPVYLPDHPLFKTSRWSYVLRCDSYYFDGDSHSTVRLDDISNSYYVTIRSNLKNYDDEIDKFIDWISPNLDKYPGDFIGYKRYEENEVPTLLFHPNQWRDVVLDKPLAEAA
jgi:hypothetical protein